MGRLSSMRLWLALALSVAACHATAQQVVGGVPFGPFIAYPGLDLALKHDDNVLLQDANRISSYVGIVSPSLNLDARHQGNQYALGYRAEAAHYYSSSADDYTDQQVFGTAALVFTGRMGLRLRAEYLDRHDPRGSTDRATSAEPDKWHSGSASGIFSFGTEGARGRIDIEAGYTDRTYTNNRASTIFADRTNTDAGATFYYRVMPLTRLLFQVKDSKIDYKESTSTLSSDEQRYLAGVTWEATAKTSGTAKVGYLRKDFDSPLRQDFSGVSWEVSARWSPRTYSTLDLVTSQKPLESSGVGDFILDRNINALWTHAWNKQVTSFLTVGFTNDEFRGGGATRNDDIINYGVKLRYEMRRWLKWDLEYTHTSRDSNVPLTDYDRNIFMLTMRATL